MLDEHVELLERALVEEEFDALARGQFAALVLGLDARLAAAEAGLFPPLFQPVEDVLHCSPCPVLSYPRVQKAYHERGRRGRLPQGLAYPTNPA